jgi:hypothetical protein
MCTTLIAVSMSCRETMLRLRKCLWRILAKLLDPLNQLVLLFIFLLSVAVDVHAFQERGDSDGVQVSVYEGDEQARFGFPES